MSRLTKKVVEAAEPRPKQFTLWCGDLRGFGVYVLPTGNRTYFVDYRNADGVRRRLTIGRHGKITTEEARKLAVATLGSAVKGDDPAEERATRRKSITMSELCDDYLKAAKRGLIMGKRGLPKKASTLATDVGRVERHIKPLLGRKLVADLVRADVVRFINDVAVGKTATVEKTDKARGLAIVEGGLGTAARTAGLLGGILSYAVSAGIIEHNPALGVRKPSYKQRQRRLSPDEFRVLGETLAAAEREGERWQAVAGIRLLALTGCRFDEIAGLKWSEVDTDGGCFRLEDSKEGRSVRPIGGAAFDVLASLPRDDGAVYVLPSVRGQRTHYGGLPGAIERTMKGAGLDNVTAHTLRHSFASVAGDLGYAEPTIAALLGHAKGSVTSRYVHHLDAVLVAAADKVARAVHGYMH